MIKIRKVSKSFDDIRAVRNTDLTVPDACIFGLLGTNGAGKSTLLRLMAGVLKPDEKLPSVRALAVDLSINPNTIQRAYSELEREGFVYSVRGRGNFVRADSGLLERQQEKLIEGLKKQLVVCRDQQVDYDRVLSCMQEVYGRCKDD